MGQGGQGRSNGARRERTPRLKTNAEAWQQLTWQRKLAWSCLVVGAVLCTAAAVKYMADSDGLTLIDPAQPGASYLMIFLLIALDAVIPIFPGETTLNAASTAAAQGTLELVPVMVMGALGAIVGDSTLFWLARRNAHRFQPQVEAARRSSQVQNALAVMDSSAPVLIVGGRYVPGLRFVVNATMGLSPMPYRRFLPWSVLSGVLWSVYTCLLAYNVALTLGDFPLASVVISGLVTTVALAVVFLAIRRRRKAIKVGKPASRRSRDVTARTGVASPVEAMEESGGEGPAQPLPGNSVSPDAPPNASA